MYYHFVIIDVDVRQLSSVSGCMAMPTITLAMSPETRGGVMLCRNVDLVDGELTGALPILTPTPPPETVGKQL